MNRSLNQAMNKDSPLCQPEWLQEHLLDPDLKVVDASWHMPAAGRNGHAEFVDAHIPGAVYFDIDKIAMPNSELPHMVASPERFGEMVGRLGICQTDTIVVYDTHGLMSAARAWWNFKLMGADKCLVLDGGLPHWLQEGRPIEPGRTMPRPAQFHATPHLDWVKDAAEVLAAYEAGEFQIVDVRSAERFTGRAPEPRPGLRSGHIPGSRNLPFGEMIRDGRLKPPRELAQLMVEAGIEATGPAIASCGSGVTAPIFSLALATMGIDNLFVYDGSWAEWGARDDLPVARGRAEPSTKL